MSARRVMVGGRDLSAIAVQSQVPRTKSPFRALEGRGLRQFWNRCQLKPKSIENGYELFAVPQLVAFLTRGEDRRSQRLSVQAVGLTWYDCFSKPRELGFDFLAFLGLGCGIYEFQIRVVERLDLDSICKNRIPAVVFDRSVGNVESVPSKIVL